MTALIAGILIVVIGRNDGSPLVALAQQNARGAGWWPPLVLIGCLPLAPLVGLDGVARSLTALCPSGTGETATLLAVAITVAIAVALRAPTSITLAFVGALAGAGIGGGDVDGALVARVLCLGLAAPVVACAASWVLATLPWHLPTPSSAPRVLGVSRVAAFVAMALAYALNDGQKVLFVTALAVGANVDVASRSPWLMVGTALFGLGVVVGLRGSGRVLRGGVHSPGPVSAVWSQAGTAVVVGAGAGVGVPLSMTQSLAGSMLGVGLRRGLRSVRWNAVGRLALAWLWTLPMAGLLGFGLSAVT